MSYKSFKQMGGGLVEVMVGLTIGLITLLTLYNSITFYQSSQRSAMSGNSALSQGIAGMQLLSSGVEQAALGLTSDGDLACTSYNIYFDKKTIANDLLIPPIAITDGGNGSDSISILYGASVSGGAPAKLLIPMPAATSDVNISLAAGGQAGAQAVLSQPGAATPCTLIGLTKVDNSGTNTVVSHAATSSYNPSSPAAAFKKPVAYQDDAVMLNVGTLQWSTWRVNNNILEVVNNISGTVEQIADNIVQVQAEYGITNGISSDITQWVAATGTWQNLNANLMRRIRAVRLVVVSRSTQKEKAGSGGSCTTTTTPPKPWPGGSALNLSNLPNWQCYRYRTIKTVVPLKNMMWGGSS